ncbi:MAG TPA: choice-of-anchor I family protein [Roseiflexaceae bacterium]|nr:choice-of-anchor I family protein [Roseiflexaceae bacterium]
MRLSRLAPLAILFALLASSVALAEPSAERPAVTFALLGRYDTGLGQESAEIVAYDDGRMYLISTSANTLDIVDIHNPSAPTLLRRVDMSAYGAGVNSVAVIDGGLAIAVEAEPKTSPGSVVFSDGDGNFLNQLVVGALPDMLAVTPNGRDLLVANEGEPSSYNQPDSVDPEGSVSVIDLRGGARSLTQSDVRTVSFADFNIGGSRYEQLDARVRIFGPGASVAQDLEPEYITVSHDSRTAYVTLQENNAVAAIDIAGAVVERIMALGFKDHSVAGNALDASDRDSAINIANWPVFGMYQPDAIASFHAAGQTYLVTANEGDARDYTGFAEEARVSSLALDTTAFPNAAALKANAALGRLNVTRTLGNTDGDNDYDQLYAFGGRSFSIWNAAGELIFDSGDQIERVTAAAVPTLFNSEGTASGFDTRSDNKGPEPEGVAIGEIRGRSYAFVGLERVGGLLVYQLDNPAAPTLVQYLAPTAGLDRGPEGVTFVSESHSPIKQALVLVGNEVSGTVSIFAASR